MQVIVLLYRFILKVLLFLIKIYYKIFRFVEIASLLQSLLLGHNKAVSAVEHLIPAISRVFEDRRKSAEERNKKLT